MRQKPSLTRRGQSLVEFALILPVIVFVIMFVLDLGRVVYYSSTLYNSAREGARYGVTHYSIDNHGFLHVDSAGTEAAARAMAVGMAVGDLTVAQNVINPPFPAVRPMKLEVTVTYRFQAITPIIWDFIRSNPIILNSKSTMTIEF